MINKDDHKERAATFQASIENLLRSLTNRTRHRHTWRRWQGYSEWANVMECAIGL